MSVHVLKDKYHLKYALTVFSSNRGFGETIKDKFSDNNFE